MVHTIHHPKNDVTIAITGKYVDLTESYKSLHEALVHGGLANDPQGSDGVMCYFGHPKALENAALQIGRAHV